VARSANIRLSARLKSQCTSESQALETPGGFLGGGMSEESITHGGGKQTLDESGKSETSKGRRTFWGAERVLVNENALNPPKGGEQARGGGGEQE